MGDNFAYQSFSPPGESMRLMPGNYAGKSYALIVESGWFWRRFDAAAQRVKFAWVFLFQEKNDLKSPPSSHKFA